MYKSTSIDFRESIASLLHICNLSWIICALKRIWILFMFLWKTGKNRNNESDHRWQTCCRVRNLLQGSPKNCSKHTQHTFYMPAYFICRKNQWKNCLVENWKKIYQIFVSRVIWMKYSGTIFWSDTNNCTIHTYIWCTMTHSPNEIYTISLWKSATIRYETKKQK